MGILDVLWKSLKILLIKNNLPDLSTRAQFESSKYKNAKEIGKSQTTRSILSLKQQRTGKAKVGTNCQRRLNNCRNLGSRKKNGRMTDIFKNQNAAKNERQIKDSTSGRVMIFLNLQKIRSNEIVRIFR